MVLIADAKQVGAEENLLPNGTFERGAWSWEIETGGVNRVSFAKGAARSGAMCARFEFTGRRWLWLDLTVDASARLPVRSGKVVKLAFFAKWLSGDNCISAGFNTRGRDDRAWLGGRDHIAITRIPKDGRWHRVEMFLLAPGFDEKRACLQLKVGAHSDIGIGKESFLVDDMTMQLCEALHRLRVRFEDGTPQDGWGTNLFRIAVFVNDAKRPLVQFRPCSPMEHAFLVEDAGALTWEHEGAGVRAADGKARFVYEVPIPCADLNKVTVETEMGATFLMRVAVDDFPFVVACRAPKPVHSQKNCRTRRVQVLTFDRIGALLVADCESRDGAISLSLISRARLARGHRLVWTVDGRAVDEVALPTVPGGGAVRLRFRCERLRASESWLVPVGARILNAAGVEVAVTRGRLSVFNLPLLQRRLAQLERQRAKLATLLRKASERQIRNYDADIVLTALKCYPSYIKDDFEHGELERAIVALDYLWRSARGAVRDVSHALERGETQPPKPKVSLLRLQVRTGGFYQGDQPVLLVGPMRDRISVDELQTIADFGFNAVELVVAPAWDSPKDYEYYARFLEVAAQRNIAVYVLLSAHYFPKWWAEKYPEITRCGEFCMPWCISSPNLRKLLKAWYERIIPFLRDKPAVLSYCLANEPHYIDTGYCDLCKAKFREWLRKRYGTIAALNERWRVHFASFAQVQPITKRRDNPAAYYDWFRFNDYRMTEFFRWERDVVKRLDPRTPIHNELMAWRAFVKQNDGIDFEDQLLLVSDLNGCDGGTRWLPRGRYAMDWLNGQAMPYDLMRSIAPDRPVFNSEWHIVTQDDVRIPSAYMRATAWHAAIHGQAGATIWVWLRRYPRQ
ncbi:MAG: beta-galactosidase, partial [Alphaproteobacteria bacterium]